MLCYMLYGLLFCSVFFLKKKKKTRYYTCEPIAAHGELPKLGRIQGKGDGYFCNSGFILDLVS